MAACGSFISKLRGRNQPDTCKRKKDNGGGEKRKRKKRKKKKVRDPQKGKSSPTRVLGTGGLSEQTVVAAHSGQSHSKTQRPGRIALWQGFRWTIKCRDIPHPLKDKAQVPERIWPAEPPLSRQERENIYDSPQ